MTVPSLSLLRHRFDLNDNSVYLLECLGAVFSHSVLSRQDLWKEISWAVALAAGNESSYLVIFDAGRNRMTAWQVQRGSGLDRGKLSTLPLQDSSRREKGLDHPFRFERLAFEICELRTESVSTIQPCR